MTSEHELSAPSPEDVAMAAEDAVGHGVSAVTPFDEG